MAAEYNSVKLPIYTPTSWAGVAPETQESYDIRATRLSESRREKAFAHANGILSDGVSKVLFFVLEMSLDTGISGNTSQARYTRDFYAHNIILPSLTVKAQCLDQGDYGVLVEFIHQSQKKAVGNAANNRTQLEIKGAGFNVKRAIMRGRHKRTCVQGFIPQTPRQYKQGEYAPVFDFKFSVAQSFEGIYEDVAAKVFENEQLSWINILEGLTTPYQPTFHKQETAANSKPKARPNAFPVTSANPPVELVQELPGGGPF